MPRFTKQKELEQLKLEKQELSEEVMKLRSELKLRLSLPVYDQIKREHEVELNGIKNTLHNIDNNYSFLKGKTEAYENILFGIKREDGSRDEESPKSPWFLSRKYSE